MIRNIIFDWSGTLVDDLPAVWKATNYVLAQAQREEMTLEQFRAEFCLPFTTFYDKYTPHVPLPQLETWFHSEFRQVQHSVCELPHAREFLEFAEAARSLVVGDMVDLKMRVRDGATYEVEVTRCFAADQISRAGLAAVYECGIFDRIQGWHEGLGVPLEEDVPTTTCLLANGQACKRTLRIAQTPTAD